MDPAVSITSRGPISEPSEVESGAHRAMQAGQGPPSLCALSPSQPLESRRNISALPQRTARILCMAWPCARRKQIPTRRARLLTRTGKW